MSRFRDRHPVIDVMVSANNKLIDFEDGMFEMAIRYGQGAYPGLRTELLLRDEVFPVCSPKLLEGPHPLRAPADLRHHTLLPDAVSRQDASPDCRHGLPASSFTGIDPPPGPASTHSPLA